MKAGFITLGLLLGWLAGSRALLADPPTREERDRAEDAAVSAAMEKAAKELDVPVSFYGKVLDQYGEPVEGALVELHLTHYDPVNAPRGYFSAVKTILVSTDGVGLFVVANERGSGLSVNTISKADYEFVRSQNKNSGFAYIRLYNDRHIPDKAKPVLFHLRKMGATTFLLKGMELINSFAVRPDGKPVVVEFSNDRNFFAPDTAEPFPGFAVTASLDKETRDWVLTFKGKHKGDRVALLDQIVYEAPAQGYEPSAELRVSLQENPVKGRGPTYPHSKEAYLVVRSEKPETYMRVAMQIYPREEERCDIWHDILLNPYGDKSFELASEVDECWDIRERLRKEAIRALCNGKLPPKPDIPKLIEEAKAQSGVKKTGEEPQM